MHKCISKPTIIGSDIDLLPGQHLAIIWTNAGILLIQTSGTNFSKIVIEIHLSSFKKMHLEMSSVKCFSLNKLNSLLKRLLEHL